jgi:hypothetical protein
MAQSFLRDRDAAIRKALANDRGTVPTITVYTSILTVSVTHSDITGFHREREETFRSTGDDWQWVSADGS